MQHECGHMRAPPFSATSVLGVASGKLLPQSAPAGHKGCGSQVAMRLLRSEQWGDTCACWEQRRDGNGKTTSESCVTKRGRGRNVVFVLVS